MRDRRSSRFSRRRLLKYTGSTATTAGMIAIAGCAGDGGNGNGGNGNGGNGNGGNGNGGTDDLDEITLTLSQFPDTIDPLDHITGDYFNVLDHIYEPLFDFEPGEGIFPRVVEETEILGDGATELQLRDDVVFHNGDQLTAEDVAWTINRSVDPDLGVQSPIGTFGLGSIEGAEATGETTLEVQYGAAPGLAEFEYGNYARAMNREWSIENHDAERTSKRSVNLETLFVKFY
nr:ABC transporter substrate-binding protein [Halalkalirubrum salinum]